MIMPHRLRRFMATTLLTATLLTVMPLSASASVDGDLNNFFNSLGYDGNVTQSHAYQGQEAGYYSGGSMFLRNAVRDLSLVHIALPSFSAGCGGIDLFLGGFSFINSDQLLTLAKNIMSGAVGYMFDLALETTVPELKSVKDFIQNAVNKINSMNINSCETAQDLVGGLWPKTQASQQQVCKDIGTQNNAFSDWAAAKQGCGTGGKFNDEMDKANKDDSMKHETIVNKNLIWDSLGNNAFLSGDNSVRELLMSLTGTIIFDDKGKISYLAGLADNADLIKALLHGGKANVYHCNDHVKCLAPVMDSLTINSKSALVNQVALMIQGLIESAESDSPITDQQKGFINSTPIAILKYIAVFLQDGDEAQAEQLTEYSETIAEDILAQYLDENIQLIQTSLTTNSFPEDVMDALNQRIVDAKKVVKAMQTNADNRLADALALDRSVQYVESQVSATLADHVKTPNDKN